MSNKDILASSRKLKRKRILLKVALAAGGFLILFAAVSALFYIPAFRIKNISVQGNSAIESGEITSTVSEFLRGKYFFIFPRDNFFIFPKKYISAELTKRFSRIKKIIVSGDFPNSILINITERKPTALFCGQPPKRDGGEASGASFGNENGDGESACFFVDGDGVIFEKAPLFSGNVYVKFYSETENGPETINKFQDIIKFVKGASDGEVKIGKIILEKEGMEKFYTSEGWYIILNESDDFQAALENLKLALKEKIKENRKYLDYIDLRFGNKLFYKYK